MSQGTRYWRVLGVVSALTIAAVAALADIQRDVERAIVHAGIPQALIGVSIVDVSGGRVLVSIGAGTPMIPASNMKLLTTGAALDVLGDDFAFRTEFSLAGDRLVVVGSGDPAFGDPAILSLSDPARSPDGLLDAIAQAIKEGGADSLSEIVIDDRVFDRELIHDAWPRDQLDRHYCAPVSGFTFQRNVIDFYPRPAGRAGDQPTFSIEPDMPWISREVVNRAKTIAKGSNRWGVRRHMSENQFTLFGDVRRRSELPVREAIHRPAAFWGELLAARLESAGVSVGEGDRRGRDASRLVEPDEVFGELRTLVVVSTPIRDIVRLCNSESVNLFAEALLKRMGHEVAKASGSWENGAAVVRMVLAERLGPGAASSTIISDGSGMSRLNRVSPRTFTAWLSELWNDPELREVFVMSLPTVGEGTLDDRFRDISLDNEVRAKSGFLNHVYTLSGYVIDRKADRAVAFSILLNDVPMGKGWQAKRLHEQIVRAADAWLSEQAGELVEARGG